MKHNLETCFSSALYVDSGVADTVVVIIDVLRATSSICTAFANGVDSIIPVATVEEARVYKEKGFLVAAERDGFVLDFADFGNSPFNFTRDRVEGNVIVYSTTNGTGIISRASNAYAVIIGSFLNLDAIVDWICKQEKDVLIVCSGWKTRFNLEDSLCAGALAQLLLQSDKYTTICDSTHAAIDLWGLARHDLWGYIQKAAQRSRLREKGLDDCIEYCLTLNATSAVPVLHNGVLMAE